MDFSPHIHFQCHSSSSSILSNNVLPFTFTHFGTKKAGLTTSLFICRFENILKIDGFSFLSLVYQNQCHGLRFVTLCSTTLRTTPFFTYATVFVFVVNFCLRCCSLNVFSSSNVPISFKRSNMLLFMM